MDKKMGRIQYYNRMMTRGSDCLEKLAIAESEYSAMLSIKNKINDELALRELQK